MDPSDSSSRRRKIPSVTDLVDELSRRLRVTPADQPRLFQAAQQVCADELKMVRTGFVAGRMEDLVERARKLLPASISGVDPLLDEWSERAPFGESGGRPLAAHRPEPGAPFDWGTETEPPVQLRPIEPLALPSSVAAPSVDSNSRYSKIPAVSPKAEPVIFKFAHEHRPGRFGTAVVILFCVVALAAGLCFVRLPRIGRIADRFTSSEETGLGKALLKPIFRAIRPKSKPESNSPSRTEVFLPQTTATASGESAPASTATKPAAPAPKTSRPAPVAAPSPAPPSSVTPPPGSTLPVSSPGSMISPEWAGKAAAYVLHFTSFQKEENARRDAARISRLVGREAAVLSVNLGKEGLWYRVVVGPFATKDAALAYREELARKGTPDMGLVYRALSPK